MKTQIGFHFLLLYSFLILYVNVAIISIADLSKITLKSKLFKNFTLNKKVLRHFITTFSKTFPRYENKIIKWYDLGSKQIFFLSLKKMQKITDIKLYK